jgi:hypothetical protein
VRWYGGSFSSTVQSAYRVDNYGKLVAQSIESEGAAGIDLRHGSGAFSLFGARYVASLPNPAWNAAVVLKTLDSLRLQPCKNFDAFT